MNLLDRSSLIRCHQAFISGGVGYQKSYRCPLKFIATWDKASTRPQMGEPDSLSAKTTQLRKVSFMHRKQDDMHLLTGFLGHGINGIFQGVAGMVIAVHQAHLPWPSTHAFDEVEQITLPGVGGVHLAASM